MKYKTYVHEPIDVVLKTFAEESQIGIIELYNNGVIDSFQKDRLLEQYLSY